jgi:hypothetical protein
MDMVRAARERAIANGMSPDRPTSGPIADMLLAAFPPAEVRRMVHHFTRFLGPDLKAVCGQHVLDRMEIDCEEAIAAAGGEILFQVKVEVADHDHTPESRTDHLIELFARTPEDAVFEAIHWVASKTSDFMPLSARVITDSTLCVF